MGSIGFMEILLILIVAAVVLGPDKLPQTARAFGKAVREFRGAVGKMEAEIKQETDQITTAAGLEDLKTDMDAIKTAEQELKETVKSSMPTIEDLKKQR